MEERDYHHFVCPNCHGPLLRVEDTLICKQCSKKFPINSDIPSFADGPSAWQFPLSASSEKILEAAARIGWRESLKEKPSTTTKWIQGSERFPIAMLASPKGSVLDAGCGWGGLSFWLAREFDHVYALDLQLDGLRFIDIRSNQENVSNITTVQGDLFSLPFSIGSLDVVILNGVLEWVGTFREDRGPKALQEMALQEVARALKPEGTLYVAIENRYGLQYFLGYREEHTGLRFISLLPRIIARGYHRIRKNNEFRALTYPRPELNQMLKRSGFTRTEWFSIFPSYRNCRFAASIGEYGALRFLIRNFLPKTSFWRGSVIKSIGWVVSHSNLLASIGVFLTPSWGIFASRQATPRLCLKGNQHPINVKASDDTEMAINITPRHASIYQVENKAGTLEGKFTIPLSEGSQKKMEVSSYLVDRMRRKDPALRRHFPEDTLYPASGPTVAYTRAVSGIAFNLRKTGHLTLFFDCIKEISLFTFVNADIQAIAGEFDIRETLICLARESCLDTETSFLQRAQFVHGDLNRKNVLIGAGRPPRAVLIDFEHAKIGPAILNWYDFLLRNFILQGKGFPIDSDLVLERCLSLPGNLRASSFLNEMTVNILNHCQVPLAAHKPLIILWLSYLSRDPVITDSGIVLRGIKAMNFTLHL